MALTKNQKWLAVALLAILFIVVVMFVYRVFFEFNNKKVNAYIMAEANKYPDPGVAAKVIHEAVMHVLKDSSLTAQVRDVANDAKIDKERVLVESAINQCKSYGYISETRYQIAS